MGVWVQKNYGAGRTSSYYRFGTVAGPVMSEQHTKLAIRAIQTDLQAAGFDPKRFDGAFDRNTENAVKAFQTANGLKVDGTVGPAVSAALFSVRARKEEAKYAIPNDYLTGLISLESAFDPGALGVNGFDTGLVQINLDPNGGHGGEITLAQAFDPRFSIPYAAKRMADAFATYSKALDVLAWKLAVAQHNSPLNARHWRDAALATPPGPTAEDSVERINKAANYVGLVDGRII